MNRKVLAICLDGYEHSLGEEMTLAGELPALARLRGRSARFQLDHGPAVRTGLAGEHVATGLSPAAAGRWAAVHFDPASYSAWQEGTNLVPFPRGLRARTAVFDAPYFALDRAPGVCGIVGWGAHDPGVPTGARPKELLPELYRRHGEYPAKEWIYGLAWPSPERAANMGRALASATRLRARAAAWLLAEGVPEWDLALVTVSEPHSAIEGLWHGIDPAHPLHSLPSAPMAGEGVRAVYRAVDALVSQLADAFPQAVIVVFSMHGMGSNRSDVASMLLLPELLYRLAYGDALFDAPLPARPTPVPIPHLAPGQKWSDWVRARFAPGRSADMGREAGRDYLPWIPAAWYAPNWQDMSCFALPSFYDGRIRINLRGRESRGIVSADEYQGHVARIEQVLRDCVDPRTGKTVVESVERPAVVDPLDLGPTESDMVVVWRDAPLALRHSDLGLIGPAPYRRTGGHTGASGFAWMAGPGIQAGDRGAASSFDVVPTLIDLVGETAPPGISGCSLAGRTRRQPRASA